MPPAEPVPAPGVLLIAPPMLLDPNFRRTVVYLCEHGPDGSFGLILNRVLALELGEVVEDVVSPMGVFLGGPVQPDTLHFLHRHGDRVEGAVEVSDGIYWGGHFEHVKMLVYETPPDDLRFFIGYAGWSPGQLEAEVEQGGWILRPAAAPLIFSEPPDRLWRTALRQMGGEYAVLANFPEDPRMN